MPSSAAQWPRPARALAPGPPPLQSSPRTVRRSNTGTFVRWAWLVAAGAEGGCSRQRITQWQHWAQAPSWAPRALNASFQRGARKGRWVQHKPMPASRGSHPSLHAPEPWGLPCTAWSLVHRKPPAPGACCGPRAAALTTHPGANDSGSLDPQDLFTGKARQKPQLAVEPPHLAWSAQTALPTGLPLALATAGCPWQDSRVHCSELRTGASFRVSLLVLDKNEDVSRARLSSALSGREESFCRKAEHGLPPGTYTDPPRAAMFQVSSFNICILWAPSTSSQS